jgi:hypothetical protein
MKIKGWTRFGLWGKKSEANKAALYWHNQGYEVKVKFSGSQDGYVLYRRKWKP